MKYKKLLALITGLFLLISSGMYADTMSADEGLSDKDIRQAIKWDLIFSDEVASHLIDVTVNNGIVTLSGTVSNILERDFAIKITESIKGVRSIVDRLNIKKADRRDSAIKKDVDYALLADPVSDSYEIDVRVSDGHVTLSGTVESISEKNICELVAKGIAGVTGISNDISIDYATDRMDSEITPEIERRLELDPYIDEELITVKVNDGKVQLNGTVGSLFEKRRVSSKAWVAGVSAVDKSGVRVRDWAKDDKQRSRGHWVVSDSDIKKAVEEALVYDPRVFSFDVKPEVEYGVVTLSGIVDNLEAKRAAEKDAKNTVGVFRVENNIKVRPVKLYSDEDLRAEVINALSKNPIVERYEITVVVLNQKVYLYGTVDSVYEKDEAETVASGVMGVVDVLNYLDMHKKWEWKSDEAIQEDIADSFFWSTQIDSTDITVEVDDAVASLYGAVEDWSELDRAVDYAFEAGAKRVECTVKINDDNIFDDIYYFGEY